MTRTIKPLFFPILQLIVKFSPLLKHFKPLLANRLTPFFDPNPSLHFAMTQRQILRTQIMQLFFKQGIEFKRLGN